VKVVVDRQGRALYFSRLPIPYQMSGARSATVHYQHYGIYLFRRDFLCRLVQEKEGELEGAEQLEQLRVLETGGTILTVELTRDEIPFLCEVNHPEDLVRAAKVLMRPYFSA
jgi:3-deoxy-manno-octulosonate cytidylyltransferase (CMP-KDO synthetase)